MRIESLKLKNYRQFREMEIPFKKQSEKDLHMIIADNGTAKTNILNAINWCLYNEEPHLSRESQQLPRLNLNSSNEVEDGSSEKVVVELATEADDNRITFERTEEYEIRKDLNGINRPSLIDASFQVTFLDERKNAKMVDGEDAESYVERFVPHNIRDFFFFNGERLDTYFKSATGAQIRHATSQISQVEILDRIAERLDNVITDLKKEAGKKSPQLETIRKKLEEVKKNYKEIVNEIDECDRQKEESRKMRDELLEKLRNIPDIEELQGKQQIFKEELKRKSKDFDERVKDKRNLLFEYGIILKLHPSLKRAAGIIQVKVDNKEIPQTYDTRLLDNILNSTRICICGREVREDSEEEERIADLRRQIKVSTDVAQELIKIQGPLEQLQERASQFRENIEKITQEIQMREEDIRKLEDKIKKIDSDITNHNVEKVKKLYSDHKNWEETYDINVQRIANLTPQKAKLARDIEQLESAERTELRRLNLLKELRQYIDFSTNALDIVLETKESMMSRIREKIEEETKNYFFSLIWKKKTFKDVSIDESYGLHLIHSQGYECLGTISASENQLLALSFVLALHEVSGFDSPIQVDNPLMRTEGEQRENLAKIFSQVSSDKQIIMLLLPSEHSSEVRKILDNDASSIRNFKLSEDENEARMEVLK